MEQTFFEMMWENAPVITGLISTSAVTGFVVYKVMKLYSRFKTVETTVQNHNVAIPDIKARHNTLEVRLAAVETKLDMLIDKVNLLTEIVLSIKKSA